MSSSGTIIHYDGSSWSEMTSGTTTNLTGVWGSTSDDVFAVGGSGTILHYDGSSWSEMTSGVSTGLNAVWGSASNDVFAVGGEELYIPPGNFTFSSFVLHYDGSSWSAMNLPSGMVLNDISAVWGSSSTDVFAVGDSGTILHYDGSSWSEMTPGVSTGLNAVWGSASDDVFAVGYGGILHYSVSVVTDATEPTSPSISIDEGASTDTLNITLTLSAYDATGVTGYYCSENSTTPTGSDSGWVSVTSAINYSGNASFVISSAQGTKTIYVWFKDSAGNVSSPASDTIVSTFIPTLSEWGMLIFVLLLTLSGIVFIVKPRYLSTRWIG